MKTMPLTPELCDWPLKSTLPYLFLHALFPVTYVYANYCKMVKSQDFSQQSVIAILMHAISLHVTGEEKYVVALKKVLEPPSIHIAGFLPQPPLHIFTILRSLPSQDCPITSVSIKSYWLARSSRCSIVCKYKHVFYALNHSCVKFSS